MHRPHNLTVIDSQASSFRLPCMQIKRIMSIQFWLWFYLEKNAFYVFLVFDSHWLFCTFEVWWHPKYIRIWFTGQNMPNRNMLRNESAHSSFTLFNVHLKCTYSLELSGVQWRNPNNSSSSGQYWLKSDCIQLVNERKT